MLPLKKLLVLTSDSNDVFDLLIIDVFKLVNIFDFSWLLLPTKIINYYNSYILYLNYYSNNYLFLNSENV